MSTKTEIIAAIKGVADATEAPAILMALGTEGDYVEIVEQERPTGAAWVPEPKTWPVVIEGIAAWLDSKGVGGAPGFKAIQDLAVSGPVNAATDLAQLTAVGVTGTLPAASAVAAGTQVVIKDVNAGGTFVAPAGADTIDGAGVPLSLGLNAATRLYSDGASDWRTW